MSHVVDTDSLPFVQLSLVYRVYLTLEDFVDEWRLFSVFLLEALSLLLVCLIEPVE